MTELEFDTMVLLDKEWSFWLRKFVPWDGFGETIAESNRIFDAKRKRWMKRMAKKFDVTMAALEARFVND